MRHTTRGQVVVEVAVLALIGGVAAFLARCEFFEAFGLRRRALELGPDPGHEDDAPAVRHPLECLDARCEVAHAARFAAIGIHHVELRRLVLLALLFALGDEGDLRAVARPGGLRVLLAAVRELARRCARGRQQPELRAALVLVHGVARQRAHGARAIGRCGELADALQLPQRVDVEGFPAHDEGRCDDDAPQYACAAGLGAFPRSGAARPCWNAPVHTTPGDTPCTTCNAASCCARHFL